MSGPTRAARSGARSVRACGGASVQRTKSAGTKLRFTLKLEKDEDRFKAVDELLQALNRTPVPPRPDRKTPK